MVYFVLADCSESLKQYQNHISKIQIDFEIKQFGSHFSLEDRGFTLIYFLLFLSLTVFLVLKCVNFCKGSDDDEEFDYAQFFTLMSLAFWCVSCFFYFLHLNSYADNGKGIKPLEVISEIISAASEFIVITMLILISWGWTINYWEMDSFDIVIPIAMLIGMI